MPSFQHATISSFSQQHLNTLLLNRRAHCSEAFSSHSPSSTVITTNVSIVYHEVASYSGKRKAWYPVFAHAPIYVTVLCVNCGRWCLLPPSYVRTYRAQITGL